MKKPDNPKERNLLKASIRRVFSRSELRKQALERYSIEHQDANRARVTKWSWCAICGVIEPRYLMQIDHRDPLVPIGTALEDMTWDDVVDRAWCSPENLQAVCKPCHKAKSKLENKERRELKKAGRK